MQARVNPPRHFKIFAHALYVMNAFRGKISTYILSYPKGIFPCCVIALMKVICPLTHIHIVAFNARINKQGPHSIIEGISFGRDPFNV